LVEGVPIEIASVRLFARSQPFASISEHAVVADTGRTELRERRRPVYLKEHGGFVDVAPDFATHRRQLAAAVRGEYDAAAIRTFIERFLRPYGWTQPATPLLVKAIEDFVSSVAAPQREDAYQA
jgi:hypothetical protein